MRRALHKPCAFTVCAHSGAGGCFFCNLFRLTRGRHREKQIILLCIEWFSWIHFWSNPKIMIYARFGDTMALGSCFVHEFPCASTKFCFFCKCRANVQKVFDILRLEGCFYFLWIYGLSLEWILSLDVFPFWFSWFSIIFHSQGFQYNLFESISYSFALASLFFQILLVTWGCSPGLAQRNGYGGMNGRADLWHVMGRAEHSCSHVFLFFAC